MQVDGHDFTLDVGPLRNARSHADRWGTGCPSALAMRHRLAVSKIAPAASTTAAASPLSTRLLDLVPSGHDFAVAASGVEEPHSGRLATADADLPSLSYGHLLGDSTGPARRGQGVYQSRRREPCNAT